MYVKYFCEKILDTTPFKEKKYAFWFTVSGILIYYLICTLLWEPVLSQNLIARREYGKANLFMTARK